VSIGSTNWGPGVNFKKRVGFSCISVVLMAFLFGNVVTIWAASVATSTTLTMTSGATPVSSGGPIAFGSELTLVAAVTSGSTKLTIGQVNFCDASATYCTDIHVLGTAQLTSAGTAVLRFHPGIGSHNYKAVFAGTPKGATAYAASNSGTVAVKVTGTYPTTTQIAQSGIPGEYTLTATVAGVTDHSGVAAPTGTVSFLDTTMKNTSLGAVALGSGTPGLAFVNSSSPATVDEPNVVTAADFNGDGIPDLAVSASNEGQVTLTILLGNGDGTFTATKTSPTVGLYPDSIVVADFNGDGIADLALTSVDQDIVTILLGKGDGTFTTSPNLDTVSTPQSVATGDFNQDGIADLAVVNANSVLIFPGNGDGTFKTAVVNPVPGIALVNVAVGDFNGDGISDLAVTNSLENGTVNILLGKGDGTFTAASVSPATGPSPDGIAVADLNGDGIADLAITDYDGYDNNAVTVLLGNGDGTFKAPAYYAGSGLSYRTIVVKDFNGDGIPDLALGEFWHGSLAVLPGNGDGTFGAAIPVDAYSQLGSGYLASADFNGDGIPDLAQPNQDTAGSVVVLLTQPTQTVTAMVGNIAPTGPGPHQVVASYPGDRNYSSSISGTTALAVQVAQPIFSPASGAYTSVQTVTISESIPGATIYYWGSGTLNTNGLVPYTGPIALTNGGSEYIQAYATETGYQQSSSATALFTLNLPVAPAPVFSVAAGNYASAQKLSITATAAGATIYYTTNGIYPTTSSAVYKGPITVSSSETVAAIVTASGYDTSNVASAQYIIASSAASLIYSLAGDGTAGYSGDGAQATIAEINAPASAVLDKAGNLYIADAANNMVRKVAAGTGIITTVAGTGIAGYSGDGGQATSAALSYPFGLAMDGAGNLYISDSGNYVVRKITTATGVITTFAGDGVEGSSGDGGAATSAGLSEPEGLAFDSAGNLYIADVAGSDVRKVSATSGTITTVAGNGSYGYSGDGGPATSASFRSPAGVAVDHSGNLYIADRSNNVIREVNASSGVISTVAGTGSASGAVPGSYSGDGGPATSATLYNPQSVAVDGAGNFYISDTYNQVIRKVTASSGIITTIAGNGSACQSFGGDGGSATSIGFCYPQSVSVDGAGNLYIADTYDYRVREATVVATPPTTQTAAPVFSVSAGSYAEPQIVTLTDTTPGASIYLTMDGSAPSTASQGYNGPVNVSGTVTIKAISVSPGYLPSTPVAAAYTITSPPAAVITTVAGSGAIGFSGAGGPATSAAIGYPSGLALDRAGNFYFSDALNEVVWMVSTKTGVLNVIAGNGTAGYSGDGGPATSAQMNYPQGVAIDSAGNLYIADNGNGVIRKVAAGTGVMTTFAGNGRAGVAGNGNGGPAINAELDGPAGLAVDSAGNLYIADSFDNMVRMASASTGIITTFAGNGNYGFTGDGGLAASATVQQPNALAFDSKGNLYIATQGNSRIRKVAADTGIITTVAGNGDPGNSGDGGLATSAEVSASGLAIDLAGNLYLSSGNATVREVVASTGVIMKVAGNGYHGYSGDNGSATIAEMAGPQGIGLDASGNLYIADYSNSRVRKVTFSGVAAAPAFSVVPGTYTSAQTVAISDGTPGATIYYTTDESTPTTGSPVYSGPLTVSSSETIEAIATASGYATSAVATAAYIINLPPAVTATPAFSPAAGSYTSAQSVTLSDTTSGATIYYTTDGTTPAPGSPVYSGPIAVSSTETIKAVAIATGYTQSAVATATYTISAATNPVPVLGSISPAFTSEGGAGFTLTVTGSGFTSGSTVSWGSTALPTQYVSATQLTAQIPAADIAAPGITPLTVENPAPGGGTSNPLQYEVDSASAGSTTPPSFSTLTAAVAPGATATYPVTLPSSATNVTTTCLNLPSGATCTYSATAGAVTITTSSATPPGTYQVTVVFTETEPGAASALALFPVVLLPVLLAMRKLRLTQSGLTVCLGLTLLTGMAFISACGGGGNSGSSTTAPPTPTHQVTSSGVVNLSVQ
jgi:sugar lactone lactonase YvrE